MPPKSLAPPKPGSGSNSKAPSGNASPRPAPAAKPEEEASGGDYDADAADRLAKKLEKASVDGSGAIKAPRDKAGWAEFTKAFNVTPDMQQELEDTFCSLSSNKKVDGVIKVQELFDGLKSLGQETPMEECEAMIKEADANENGEVDYGEFCLMIARRHKEQKQLKNAQKSRKSLHPSLSDADDLLAQIMAQCSDADAMMNSKAKATKKTVGLWKVT